MSFYRHRSRTRKHKQSESLILSDSLGRNIRYIGNTDTQFFPGCIINGLAHKINSGEIDISKYSYISLIIGTNDLGPKYIWKFYKKQKILGKTGRNLPHHNQTPIPVILSAYQNLFDTVKKFNPVCAIFCFGILPRPYDHHRNQRHHTDTNRQLLKLCKKNDIIFVITHTSFLKFGSPIEELFADGLHLSIKGNRQLNRLIVNATNSHKAQQNRKSSTCGEPSRHTKPQ